MYILYIRTFPDRTYWAGGKQPKITGTGRNLHVESLDRSSTYRIIARGSCGLPVGRQVFVVRESTNSFSLHS